MTKAAAGKKPAKKVSASNVINDPTQNLQTFDLRYLQQYTYTKVKNKILPMSIIGEQTFIRSGRPRRWATQEKVYATTASDTPGNVRGASHKND